MSNPLVRHVNEEVHTHSVHLGMTTSYAQVSDMFVLDENMSFESMLKIYIYMHIVCSSFS